MTKDLKDYAKGSGIRAIEISQAIRSLENRAVITFDPGPSNAKYWRLLHLPNEPAQRACPTWADSLPSLPKPAGQAQIAPQMPAPSLEGQAGAGADSDSAVCADCGTTVPADPSFAVLRCTICAVRAGREERAAS